MCVRSGSVLTRIALDFTDLNHGREIWLVEPIMWEGLIQLVVARPGGLMKV